ncbi:fimbrial protein [Citrobacter amalonaticus]|uniref:fimbrial protein n=1 Tax=Citrobacter amalonaticus TaxID=35703 RepID=UPI00300C3B41
MKNTQWKIVFVSVFFSIFFINNAYADCTISLITRTVNFGNVLVQRDAPVGSVLATQTTPASGTGFVNCPAGSGGYVKYSMDYSTTTLGNHIYATNIPGVGITAQGGNGMYMDYPATYSGYNTGPIVLTDTSPKVFTLIKTSPLIQSGVLDSKRLMSEGFGYSGVYSDALVISMGDASITVLACSINTPVVNVVMGDYLTSEFSGIGHTTAPHEVPIMLDCDAGARINAVVVAEADTSTTQAGAIKVSSGGATGVAVQLLDKNGTAVKLNQKFLVDTTTASGQYNFNWTARYLQTQSTVTTGKADAVATIQLTYE